MTKEDFNKVWKDSTKEEILNQYYYDYTELNETIDKAIEYLKNREYDNNTCSVCSVMSDDLLQILKGEDKG